MRLTYIVAGFLLLLPAMAGAEWKEAAGTTQPLQRAVPELGVSSGVGDLALDPAFNVLGFMRFDFNDANSKFDRALRIFPVSCGASCTSYLVFGAHPNGGGTWDVLVAKIDSTGGLDPNFGVGGRIQVATPLLFVNDVAIDELGTRFYFAGWKPTGATTDNDFAVTCIDASGIACADFGTQGTVTKWFDLGSYKNDMALQIRYRPAVGPNPASLLVGGIAGGGSQATPTLHVGVMAIDPATGTLVQSFGDGGKTLLQIGGLVDEANVWLHDMALSPSNVPGGERLYLAGNFKQAPASSNNFDGFVAAIDPEDGSLATSFDGGMISIHKDIGPSDNPYDVVAGITVLPDGKVAMVGISMDINGKGQLLLARATALDGLDPTFCEGGACVHPSQDPSADIFASSIGVRPTTHDLLVTASETRDVGTGQLERMQVVEQYSESGITLHGRREMEYDVAQGQPDATNAGQSIGLSAGGGYAMIVGTTRWNDITNDYDITVVRTIATDELFTGGFGEVGVE